MVATKRTCDTDPFASPTTETSEFPTSPAAFDIETQQSNVLATACLLLEQLQELENICSTTEERVRRKRQALQELEVLISGSNAEVSPGSPACPANTPISHRFARMESPRLRGLFDLRGPGRINQETLQSSSDYSPENRPEQDALRVKKNVDLEDEWVDDDEKALLGPFDDKYELCRDTKDPPQTPDLEKALPGLPQEQVEVVGTRSFARKLHLRAQVLALRRPTVHSDVDSPLSRKVDWRNSRAVARRSSNKRRPSVRSTKAFESQPELNTKGTMRRGSWKRSIMENTKAKGGAKKVSQADENANTKDSARRKERRKGLWSIYSVCSELGLNASHHAA
ncbi:hypothetical protein PAXRUDRAFT_11281 [Paxillus rubicundulus Ve08.2h10]|uniref:Uncharacterized protein n=1 Tax=Paxillus rubicundulus Ve08.2h10 TaxID=930991 RepID=A0A0D0DRJ9_9AGAM|nr:hypothetical protein PAXRUDRAFT_11281 [Paxillus rubicundulus Ve08.2h10]